MLTIHHKILIDFLFVQQHQCLSQRSVVWKNYLKYYKPEICLCFLKELILKLRCEIFKDKGVQN